MQVQRDVALESAVSYLQKHSYAIQLCMAASAEGTKKTFDPQTALLEEFWGSIGRLQSLTPFARRM